MPCRVGSPVLSRSQLSDPWKESVVMTDAVLTREKRRQWGCVRVCKLVPSGVKMPAWLRYIVQSRINCHFEAEYSEGRSVEKIS